MKASKMIEMLLYNIMYRNIFCILSVYSGIYLLRTNYIYIYIQILISHLNFNITSPKLRTFGNLIFDYLNPRASSTTTQVNYQPKSVRNTSAYLNWRDYPSTNKSLRATHLKYSLAVHQPITIGQLRLGTAYRVDQVHNELLLDVLQY